MVLVAKLLETRQPYRGQNPSLTPQQKGNHIIIAAVTGLLFGLHPLHVESVAWVSERKDLLCAMFFLLSTLTYTKYVSSGGGLRNKHYILVLFLFSLALLSKPMAVSLPAVLLILDWYPFNRISSMKSFLFAFLEKLPLMALSLISSVLTVFAQKAGGALQTFEAIPLSSRMLIAAKSLLSYLWKIVLPINLIPYYPYPSRGYAFSAEYLLSVIVVFGITAACIFMVKKQRLWSAVWSYYVITLLPVLGIVQVGGQAMADRYTYLPSLGPFILAGSLAAYIWRRFIILQKWTAQTKFFCVTVALFILLLLSALTVKQIWVWKDGATLWTYVIKKEPVQVPLAYNNLGNYYYSQHNPDKAVEQYQTVIKMQPDNVEAHTQLGITYQTLNKPDKAVEQYLIAIKLQPENAQAYNNLGIIYQSNNKPDKAVEYYLTAIKSKPEYADPHFNLGVVYYQMGQIENARREFITGLKINPYNKKAQQLLNDISRIR